MTVCNLPQIGELKAHVREVLRSGQSPEPTFAAFLEAVGANEVLLPTVPQAGSGVEPPRLPWKTLQLDPRTLAEEHERARIERLTALQKVVEDSSLVHYVQKTDRNQAINVCIGRAPRNDIVISDPTVSSIHAHVEVVEGGLFLLDRESSNGTFINRERLLPGELAALQNGDCVRFGCRVFYFLDAGRLLQFVEMQLVKEVPANPQS